MTLPIFPVLMGFTRVFRVLLSFTEFTGIFLPEPGLDQVLMNFTRYFSCSSHGLMAQLVSTTGSR